MYQIPQDMIRGDVALLDPMDAVRFHHQKVIQTEPRHCAAVRAGKADGHQPHLSGLDEGVDEIA